MKGRSLTTIIILGLLVILLFWGCGQYNSIIPIRNEVNNKWAQVENQYQRRADLIDNLVNTVKAQVKAENKTLVEVIQARNQARSNMNALKGVSGDSLTQEKLDQYRQNVDEYQRQTQLFINVVSEQYPELKSSTAFSELRTEMSGTENRVSVARMDFNNAVTTYNNKVQTFPINLFAGSLGFKPRGFFQAQQGADKAPKVSDDFMK